MDTVNSIGIGMCFGVAIAALPAFYRGVPKRALPRFERAISEAEMRDAFGRVDPERVGASRHQLGACLESLGRNAGALACFQRSVERGERGNATGVVR